MLRILPVLTLLPLAYFLYLEEILSMVNRTKQKVALRPDYLQSLSYHNDYKRLWTFKLIGMVLAVAIVCYVIYKASVKIKEVDNSGAKSIYMTLIIINTIMLIVFVIALLFSNAFTMIG